MKEILLTQGKAALVDDGRSHYLHPTNADLSSLLSIQVRDFVVVIEHEFAYLRVVAIGRHGAI